MGLGVRNQTGGMSGNSLGPDLYKPNCMRLIQWGMRLRVHRGYYMLGVRSGSMDIRWFKFDATWWTR